MMDRRRLLSDGQLAWLIIIVALLIDQIIKIEVKTSMYLGESIHITDWFYISFIENNGMAFGMTFFNKLVLSLFRIVAISAIAIYIYKVIKRPHRVGYVVCLSLIIAGAAGNMFDSMFYGLIFCASSPFYLSEFVTFGTGYAPFLQGKVVDMFYFPLIKGTWPSWMPFWGGDDFIFFSPVFNFADASISVSVVLLLLFYREEISKITLKKETNNVEE